MNELLIKLHKFIRKYHNVLLLQNLIFFAVYSVCLVLLLSVIEYSFWLESNIRLFVFIAFLLTILSIGVFCLLLPFVKITKYYRKINEKQAADIIGKFFPDINDKLRNTLELNDLITFSCENQQLLIAAIEQKSSDIKKFNFRNAVQTKHLKKIFYISLIVFIAFVSMTYKAPDIFFQPIERIVNFNKHYEKPPPFRFILQNSELSGIQGESETISLLIEGNKLPSETYIEIENYKYLMNKTSSNTFSYDIPKLRQSFNFVFFANDYFSKSYEFKVYSRPVIMNFQTTLDYPKYINEEKKVLENTTDFSVPVGTKITCMFIGRDIEILSVICDTIQKDLKQSKITRNAFAFEKRIMKNSIIKIVPKNSNAIPTDTLFFYIHSIPDEYPQIEVAEMQDSIFIHRLYFRGNITDDYGFTDLTFNYKTAQQEKYTKNNIPIYTNIITHEFYYFFDFSDVENWRESTISYYFEVRDNDMVLGPKSSATMEKFFILPTTDEIDDIYSQKSENVKAGLSQAFQTLNEIQDEISKIQLDMMLKSDMSWEDKKRVEDLLKKQMSLEKLIEQLMQENTEKNLFEEQMNDLPVEILEKQRKLEELFNQVFDEQMQELIRQLQEMLFELNKDKILEHLKDIKMRNEDIERELDRNISILKQFEFEKSMEETLDKLNKLIEEQHSLKEETEKSDQISDNLIEKQKEIEKNFEKLSEKIDELKEMNKDLDFPIDFPDTDELSEEIKQSIQESLKEMSKDKKNKAAQQQQKSSEKMQELSNQLQAAMDEYMEETLAEDIDNLKMILKNLIRLSFFQEDILESTKSINRHDPSYRDILSNQKRLMQRFKVIEDSLHALSKRQIIVEPVITKDLRQIRYSAERIDDFMERGVTGAAANQQQYLMQSANNLSLLLIEALENMNQMLSEMMGSGKSSCPMQSKQGGSKQGGSKPKPSCKGMRQFQEQLNRQMEEMLKKMEGGKCPGGQQGSQSLSEQFARMAAQQEALRRRLQKYSEELKSSGDPASQLLNEIMKEMEKTERDLINKKMNNEVINRQKDILVRLLESEKAELEREKDEKRTSRTGKITNISNPEEFFKYKYKKGSDEIIKTTPPNFNSFYRRKVSEFFINLTE